MAITQIYDPGTAGVPIARIDKPPGSATVIGNASTEPVTVGNLTVNGTAAITGAVTQTGAAVLGSTLAVTGATTLSSTLAVTGALTQTGAAAFSSTVAVTGALTQTGAATFASTVGVTGALTPTGGVAAAGGFAVAARLFHSGGLPARVSTDGTDATPVATEVYFAEVFVDANVTLTGVSIFNGSVASGNVKVGLANSSGVVVATSASTAMAGTDAYQRVPFTATYAAKGPATYYVLLFVDNNTARVNCHTFGDFVSSKQTGQVFATGFTTITPGTAFVTALGPISSLY